jgi:hypothetical protein
MKKFNKFSIFYILIAFLFSGCKKDFLDINRDPNNPATADVSLVLPAAQNSLATVVGGELFNLGAIWGQYMAQSPFANQYKELDGYYIATDYFDRVWQEAYSGGINDFEDNRKRGNASYKLVATVLQAYYYQALVDAVDKVPFTEALKGADGLTQPVFDDGEKVYDGILANINQALADYQSNPTGNLPPSADLIYSGDINQWIKFANTLKLRIYLRMSNTSRANPQAVIDLLNEGNFITQDASFKVFIDQNNKRNPWYETNVSYLGNANHKASNTLLKVLTSNNDPRVGDIYKPGIGTSILNGIDQGSYSEVGVITEPNIAIPNYDATSPVYFITLFESSLLQAEAAVRYNVGNAQSLYENAIEQNFTLRGLTGAASLYTDGAVYNFPSSGTQEQKLFSILYQKWISMAMIQNYEAMTEIRRTGIPEYTSDRTNFEGKLLVSVESQLPEGQVPGRVWYPDISVSRNKNTPSQPASLSSKIWWAK